MSTAAQLLLVTDFFCRVNLDQCVICSGAKLGKSSKLTRCRIGYGEDIAAESVMKDEVFPSHEN